MRKLAVKWEMGNSTLSPIVVPYHTLSSLHSLQSFFHRLPPGGNAGDLLFLFLPGATDPGGHMPQVVPVQLSGPEGRALHAAPDVWLHSSTKRKRAFPVRCAKAAGRRIIVLADPGLVKQTVPTDATSGGVEMYRDYQGCS